MVHYSLICAIINKRFYFELFKFNSLSVYFRFHYIYSYLFEGWLSARLFFLNRNFHSIMSNIENDMNTALIISELQLWKIRAEKAEAAAKKERERAEKAEAAAKKEIERAEE